MASALASTAEERAQLRLLRQADGPSLLCNHPAFCSQGPGDADASCHCAEHGNYAAINDGGHGSSGVPTKPGLPEISRDMQPSLGNAGLRSSGNSSSHLRPLRHSVRFDAVGDLSAGHAESFPVGQDTFEPSRAHHGRTPRQKGRKPPQGGKIPRLFSALLNILAGICASTSSTTSSSAIFQGGSPEGSSEDGSPSQKHDATLGRIEPAYSATEAMAWLGERPDEHDEHRYGSLPRGHGLVSGEEWVEPNWAMPDDYDHLEGSEGEQFDPNDLIPHQDYEDEEEGYGEEF